MIEINLLPDELKARARQRKSSLTPEIVVIRRQRLLYFIPLVFAVLLCIHLILAVNYIAKAGQLKGLDNKWKGLESQRKALRDFSSEYLALSQDSKTIQQLIQQRLNWAEKLNKLSLLLPSGVWLDELSLTRKDFSLKGSVVSPEKEEMNLVDKFMDSLKADKGFFKGFTSLKLSSVQKRTLGGYEVSDFILSGTLNSK